MVNFTVDEFSNFPIWETWLDCWNGENVTFWTNGKEIFLLSNRNILQLQKEKLIAKTGLRQGWDKTETRLRQDWDAMNMGKIWDKKIT